MVDVECAREVVEERAKGLIQVESAGEGNCSEDGFEVESAG